MTYFAPDTLSQAINPWSWMFKSSDNSTGLININTYKSGNPTLEHRIIHEVAGYGMQLSAIEALLEVMLQLMPKTELTREQQDKIDEFKGMMEAIRTHKEKSLLEEFSPGGVEELIHRLALLEEKDPGLYEKVVGRLKKVL
ncbi:hypothetical protein [Emcibacter nanhaiensis]|uniref:Uncharacterized protein n=1 Tax=Emcibacter nanhaiensis TaxID=1505037 RepID=A0A501PFZ3_9PROT|nr:hypothetical protein [Emcibacter nanhaiensis]TPD58884.1 hypothetical protein FIV46_13970 [Emcibacter nanhaiensis]